MSKIKITKDQLKKIKKIGQSKDGEVFHLLGKGGHNFIVLKTENGSKLLATAPHIGLAKFIAQKNQEDVVFDELSKSGDFEIYRHLVPVYEVLTQKMADKF
jgi:hypothetical protein